MKVPPVLGVVLLIVVILATFVFARFHVDPGTLLTTVLGVALAILFGQQHVQIVNRLEDTKQELSTLRASMRPRREPSIPDATLWGRPHRRAAADSSEKNVIPIKPRT